MSKKYVDTYAETNLYDNEGRYQFTQDDLATFIATKNNLMSDRGRKSTMMLFNDNIKYFMLDDVLGMGLMIPSSMYRFDFGFYVDQNTKEITYMIEEEAIKIGHVDTVDGVKYQIEDRIPIEEFDEILHKKYENEDAE